MKTIFSESPDGLEVFLTVGNCPNELRVMLESAGFACCDNGDFVLSGSTLEDAKALYKKTVKEYKALYVPAKRGAYGISHNNETTWVKPDDLKEYFLSI